MSIKARPARHSAWCARPTRTPRRCTPTTAQTATQGSMQPVAPLLASCAVPVSSRRQKAQGHGLASSAREGSSRRRRASSHVQDAPAGLCNRRRSRCLACPAFLAPLKAARTRRPARCVSETRLRAPRRRLRACPVTQDRRRPPARLRARTAEQGNTRRATLVLVSAPRAWRVVLQTRPSCSRARSVRRERSNRMRSK